MVKFYLNKELFTEDYRKTAINHTAYEAVRNRREAGNKLLDFSETIWDRDVPEIIDTLMRMGETEFTISSNFSGLVKTLADFDKLGAKVAGMTEINANHRDRRTGELKRVPAILMRIG
ncbi:MAG: hypothetical protein J1F64_05840 [Oscillospiraceae bacterium]|nr:hypothetical protein [Oscillospiraceae bacterium]